MTPSERNAQHEQRILEGRAGRVAWEVERDSDPGLHHERVRLVLPWEVDPSADADHREQLPVFVGLVAREGCEHPHLRTDRQPADVVADLKGREEGDHGLDRLVSVVPVPEPEASFEAEAEQRSAVVHSPHRGVFHPQLEGVGRTDGCAVVRQEGDLWQGEVLAPLHRESPDVHVIDVGLSELGLVRLDDRRRDLLGLQLVNLHRARGRRDLDPTGGAAAVVSAGLAVLAVSAVRV